MLIRERLYFVYFLTILFVFLTFIIVSHPFKGYIEYIIEYYHPSINNIALYNTIILGILFYISLSVYDLYIRD